MLAFTGGEGVVLQCKLSPKKAFNQQKGTAMNGSSTGLPDNIAKCLAHVFGWISGLAIFFLEKEDVDVRFHGAQSIVLFGSLTVLNIFLPIIPTKGDIPWKCPLLIAQSLLSNRVWLRR